MPCSTACTPTGPALAAEVTPSLQRRPTSRPAEWPLAPMIQRGDSQRARVRVWDSRPSLILDGSEDTERRTAVSDAARARPPSVRWELQFGHRRSQRVPGRLEFTALGFQPAFSHRCGASDAVRRLWHRRPARARAPWMVLTNCHGTGRLGGGARHPEPGPCVPANGPGRARAFVSRSCDGPIRPGPGRERIPAQAGVVPPARRPQPLLFHMGAMYLWLACVCHEAHDQFLATSWAGVGGDTGCEAAADPLVPKRASLLPESACDRDLLPESACDREAVAKLRHVALTEMNIGNVHLAQGDYENAPLRYQKALKYKRWHRALLIQAWPQPKGILE